MACRSWMSIAVLGAVLAAAPLVVSRETRLGDDEGYVGRDACAACHVVEADHWDDTLHARVFAAGARRPLEGRACEACHGPGAAHVAAPADPTGIVSFTHGSGVPVGRQNAACLTCHAGGPRIRWPGSPHQLADLGCSDCHNPMAKQSARRLMRESSVSATCFGCHPQQRTAFRKRSHMPLFEGKISCEDCHDPHGARTAPLLRADSVNQLCYGCHAEKRGPFLFEHAPVRESCLHCHRAHGSNHEKLLVSSRTVLCQTCHAMPGHSSAVTSAANLARGPLPDERLLNRACLNCHAQIHGSNHPSGPRFHR